MDGKTLARIAAIVFVAVAITAAVIDGTRKKAAPIDASVTSATAPAEDPLQGELIRCQLLGESGARDPTCLRVWAENRRRFLAPGARPEARLPDALPPVAPKPTEAR
jgi:conjugative transfer region protein TrbK